MGGAGRILDQRAELGDDPAMRCGRYTVTADPSAMNADAGAAESARANEEP